MRRPENDWRGLPEEYRGGYEEEIWDLVETDVKYEGYIQRQEDQIARTQRMDERPIPGDIDFLQIQGLKKEAQLKLNQIRPQTLGQAGRISGITPADISLLAVYLERGRRAKEAEPTES